MFWRMWLCRTWGQSTTGTGAWQAWLHVSLCWSVSNLLIVLSKGNHPNPLIQRQHTSYVMWRRPADCVKREGWCSVGWRGGWPDWMKATVLGKLRRTSAEQNLCSCPQPSQLVFVLLRSVELCLSNDAVIDTILNLGWIGFLMRSTLYVKVIRNCCWVLHLSYLHFIFILGFRLQFAKMSPRNIIFKKISRDKSVGIIHRLCILKKCGLCFDM